MATANEIEIRVTVDDKTKAPFQKIENKLKSDAKKAGSAAGKEGGVALRKEFDKEASKLGDGSIRGASGGLVASMRQAGVNAGKSFVAGFKQGHGKGGLFGDGLGGGTKSFGRLLAGPFKLVKTMFDNVGTAISGLLTGVMSFGEAARTVFDGVGKSLGSIAGAAGGVVGPLAQIGSILALVGAVAGPALVGIGAIAAAVGGTLATALVAGVGALGLFNVKAREAFTALGEEIQNSLARLTDQSGLTKTFQKMADVFRTTFRNLRTEIKDMMITVQPMLMQLASGVAQLFNTLVPRIQTALKGMGPVIAGFASMLSNIGVGLGDMFIKLSEHAEGFGNTFRGLGEVFRQVLPALGEFMGIIADQMGPVLQQLAPALRDMVTQLAGPFASALKQIGPMMPGLIDGFTQVMNAIIPLVPPLTEMASSALPALASALGLVNDVMPFFKASFDAIVATFNFVIAQAKLLVASLKAGWQAMQGDFEGAKQTMIAAGQEWAVAMGQQGQAAGEGVRANLNNGMNAAVGVVQTNVNQMVSNITSQQGRFQSAGSSLANSFRSGWVAAANAAVQAVRNTVAQIAALLPGSPAKKGPFSGRGYVKIRGQHLARDFAKGIRKGGTGLQSAASEILRQMNRGGKVFEDFSFRGNSGNVKTYNDQLADMFKAYRGAAGSGGRKGFLQKIAGGGKVTPYSGQGAPSASMLRENYSRQLAGQDRRTSSGRSFTIAGDCDSAIATLIMRLIREGKLRVA